MSKDEPFRLLLVLRFCHLFSALCPLPKTDEPSPCPVPYSYKIHMFFALLFQKRVDTVPAIMIL